MAEIDNTPTATVSKPYLEKYYSVTISEISKLLPLAYLCTIGIGMVFNYFKYEPFGINIFQYASVFDFLISPFEDYFIILFVLFSFLFPIALYHFDCYFEKRFPKVYRILSFNLSHKKGYRLFRFFLIVFTIVAYVWITAQAYGNYSSRKITRQADIEVRYADNSKVTGKQIGKTNGVIFIYTEDGRIIAIPIQSLIKEISYAGREF